MWLENFISLLFYLLFDVLSGFECRIILDFKRVLSRNFIMTFRYRLESENYAEKCRQLKSTNVQCLMSKQNTTQRSHCALTEPSKRKGKITASIFLNAHLQHCLTSKVAWPSGLRRWFKAPVSSEAWVRIPQLPK